MKMPASGRVSWFLTGALLIIVGAILLLSLKFDNMNVIVGIMFIIDGICWFVGW